MRSIKIFNASLDRWRTQCDSRVFDFAPRAFAEMRFGKTSTQEIPEQLSGFLLQQTKDNGCFLVHEGMTEAEFKKEQRTALLCYLGGALHERVTNYLRLEDEYKRKGITYPRSKKFDDALRWQKEIRYMLELEAPIEEELSFLDRERRKELGVDNKNITQIEIDPDLFNPEVIKASNQEVFGTYEPPKASPTSFEGIKLNEVPA